MNTTRAETRMGSQSAIRDTMRASVLGEGQPAVTTLRCVLGSTVMRGCAHDVVSVRERKESCCGRLTPLLHQPFRERAIARCKRQLEQPGTLDPADVLVLERLRLTAALDVHEADQEGRARVVLLE